jgi:hypothetical protein
MAFAMQYGRTASIDDGGDDVGGTGRQAKRSRVGSGHATGIMQQVGGGISSSSSSSVPDQAWIAEWVKVLAGTDLPAGCIEEHRVAAQEVSKV